MTYEVEIQITSVSTKNRVTLLFKCSNMKRVKETIDYYKRPILKLTYRVFRMIPAERKLIKTGGKN